MFGNHRKDFKKLGNRCNGSADTPEREEKRRKLTFQVSRNPFCRILVSGWGWTDQLTAQSTERRRAGSQYLVSELSYSLSFGARGVCNRSDKSS